MFTGLIEEIGSVRGVERSNDGARLRIAARRVVEDARVGDSIAIDGCCLTVTGIEGDGFVADVVPETLRRTTIGAWVAGRRVNLERALQASQRMGGHFVQGHIDGVARITALAAEGDGRRMTLVVPAPLAAFVAEKGSLAVDGVSLTVAGVVGCAAEIAYIPHTLEATVAGAYGVGQDVNIEVDLVARYVARWLAVASGKETRQA